MLRSRRPSFVVLGALAVAGMLFGCAPDPAPSPTPTPAFASDEDAFAAAEEVYRAYNDAVNAQRAGDESADPTEYLIGAALETDLESSRLIEGNGIVLVGDGSVAQFRGVSADLERRPVKIEAAICIDASATKAFDSNGADVTPADRPTRVLLEVAFVESNGTLLISETQAAEEFEC